MSAHDRMAFIGPYIMHVTTVYLFVLLFDIVSERVWLKQGQGPKQVVYSRFYMYMN